MTDESQHERALAEASAALDGEVPLPAELDPTTVEFLAGAQRLRRLARVTEAEPMPDLTAAVLRDTTAARSATRRWASIASVAAAFVIGVAVAAAFLLDRNLETRPSAAAAVEADARAALGTVGAVDATISITEFGVHPDVARRDYLGELHYRSPERLSLTLEETTELPGGWPANDVVVVVDEDIAWRSRRLRCPVGSMPGCLTAPTFDGVAGRAPFSSGWAAPLELVVPVDSIGGATIEQLDDDTIAATTTVSDAGPLATATVETGAFRLVHGSDEIEILLGADTFALRGFTIRAGDSSARELWATTWGYDDEPGDVIFTLTVTGTGDPPADARVPDIDFSAGGFVDHPVDLDVGDAIPKRFRPHRSGTLTVPGTHPTTIATWVDGRAYIRVRATTDPDVGIPPGEIRTVGAGVGIVDDHRRHVTLIHDRGTITVSGTIAIEDLVAVAAGLPVIGQRPPPDPEGTPTAIDVDGTPVIVEIRPGSWLPPADRGDITAINLRGTTARYSPNGELSWLENGNVVVLLGADLPTLLAAAERVVVP